MNFFVILALIFSGAASAEYKNESEAGVVIATGNSLSQSLSFKQERFFLMGLVSFLLAHVVYIFTFINDSEWALDKAWLLPVLAVFGIAMIYVLNPHLGKMRIPVYVYVSVILTMDVMAVMRGHGNWVLIAGAFTFTASDTILALNKFRKPIPGAQYWIMATYYAGQALIFLAFTYYGFGSDCL